MCHQCDDRDLRRRLFLARAAHALVHISGFGQVKARTALFTVTWLAFITHAVVLLLRAM